MDNGVNGYLCAPREAGDLASKLRAFIDLTSAEKQKMGTASREKVERQFDVKRVVVTYIDLIDAQIAPARQTWTQYRKSPFSTKY